jgi:hypothetical protein
MVLLFLHFIPPILFTWTLHYLQVTIADWRVRQLLSVASAIYTVVLELILDSINSVGILQMAEQYITQN